MNQFRSVLEDIDWLWEEWWVGQPDALSAGALRRGSTSLHLLLVQGLLGKAWRACGFPKEPTLYAPDLIALAEDADVKPENAACCIAGGGTQKGLRLSFVGGFRVDNPTTGVPAEAEVGFALKVVSVAGAAGPSTMQSPLERLVERKWTVSEYLRSPSAIRLGQLISRRDIINYFRNYAGAAHHDLVDQGNGRDQTKYKLIAELEKCVTADVRDGLYFELLSIGQALATSPDVRELAAALREAVLPK